MGPSASILLSFEIESIYQSAIESLIDSLSEQRVKKDFWIKERPFLLDFGWQYDTECEEYEDLQFLIGWSPKDQVILAAGCNQGIDHTILCDLCIALADRFHGYIDFGTYLNVFTNDDRLLSHPGHISYYDSSILSSELMLMWCKHKDFRMVK